MPDTLKQFYNATINVTGLTGAQTAPLFTNDATTRAVIKDIVVRNTFPAVPSLTVAGTPTASLGSNISGSEIVDISQAVGLSFSAPLSFTSSLLVYLSSNSPNTQRLIRGNILNGTQVTSTTVDQTIPAVEAGTNFAPVVYYAPDGDVFSVQTNGNDTNLLLKNAGSAGGTRTTINTGNTTTFSPIAFDGINTFYWLSSPSNLRAFNADTETTTNITMDAHDAAGSRGRIVHSNGYLFYTPALANYINIIEISTGRWIRFTGAYAIGNWDSTDTMPGFWFEPSTRVATVMYFRSAGPNYYYRILSPALPAFTVSSTVISTDWQQDISTAGGFGGRSAATSNTNIVLSSANEGVINDSSNLPCTVAGLAGGVGTWALTLINGAFTSTFWRPRRHGFSSAIVNTTNFPNTISLRITGVEVTS